MSDSEIVFSRRGNIGHVLLNRPKALNALTDGMCVALFDQLRAWRNDEGVKAVVIRGAGEKAFCAGGDVIRLYEEGRAKGAYPRDFWRTEYRCNTLIKHYPKPYIALIDGIVMGGGVGVSQHGSHRVVTEKTTFAMPETGIGLFPDVGGSYFLPRLPGKAGMYLGLTGQRLKAADCIAFGVADTFVASARLNDLEEHLAAKAVVNPRAISDIIREFSESPPGGTLKDDLAKIDRHFAASSIEAILASLRGDGDAWAASVANELEKKSPLSLKITFRQLTEGARLNFNQAMQMEWRLANRMAEAPEFYEGVRALLIDKDMKPQWRPPSLDAVTSQQVDAFFAPLPGDELELSDIN